MKTRTLSGRFSWLARVGLAAAGLALTAVTAGCVAAAVGAAAGAGAVAYARGNLEANVPGDYAAVSHAADEALDDLKFARISSRTDALTSIYEARTADDTKVTVRVEEVTDAFSKVEIRVGLLGDEVLSRRILDQIKGNV